MRPIIKLTIFCLAVILIAAGFSKRPPAPASPPPAEAVPPSNKVPPAGSLDARSEIEDVALNSSCKRAKFDEKGSPPQGYMRGVALSYARAVCNPNAGEVIVASKPLGSSSSDALAWYGLRPADAAERLQFTYALTIGSAARESDWRWFVGRDTLAKESDRRECASGSGKTCEAGIHQTSYNSRSADPSLPLLFAHYRTSKAGCFSTEYKGASKGDAANLKNWGSDPNAVEFQRLQKECPGFAVEGHAVMLRVSRSHYGPINRKKALFKKECVQMFKDVKKVIDRVGCDGVKDWE
ncbi:hypothetical protein BdPhPhi1402_gp39 [Bdellovibrio phage phi1402]|uniref:hypothetical protein n=1 Tax=Bdellovibrio phage phi1402 TaxID=1035662 RepID=UPI000211A2E5|nr:hypothetical protein BdPhPhi1402_gp39 [Bdellovibrio phage phi1402]AEG42336.1 hypothetical protein [Bdellovibrio phage phi1402]